MGLGKYKTLVNNYYTPVKITERGWATHQGHNCSTWYDMGYGFTVEISITKHDRSYKKDLCNLWLKAGWIPEFYEYTIHANTYYTDKDGRCSGCYDLCKLSEDGKRVVVDFDWLLPLSDDNIKILVAECNRRRIKDIKFTNV